MLTDPKVKVCIVSPSEQGGGAEYQISLLIDSLVASNRYEIHYLAHFLDEHARLRNYHISRIGAGGPIPSMGYLLEAGSLYRALRDINPRVIYQRVACAYTGICAWYSRRQSVPLVWHVAHDTDVSPISLDRGRNFLRPYLEKWAIEYGIRNATRIVAQTRRQVHLLQENYGRKAHTVIGNFHPAGQGSLDKGGPFTVVWIGNLKPWKRPDAFIRLAQQLTLCRQVRFVMIGAPAAGSRNQIWQRPLIDSIEGTPNLEYWGQKSHTEVNELLDRSHILVNTSTHEGFPNTFIQAWLRGVAVVSLQVDPDRVLEQLRLGIAAPSEEGLVQAVRFLIENADARADYALRGRKHATANHSLRNADDLVRVIDVCAADRVDIPVST
jgi:glycosyltransferase involved in cell wall biosynthesis